VAPFFVPINKAFLNPNKSLISKTQKAFFFFYRCSAKIETFSEKNGTGHENKLGHLTNQIGPQSENKLGHIRDYI
jgi:hypothetical protein